MLSASFSDFSGSFLLKYFSSNICYLSFALRKRDKFFFLLFFEIIRFCKGTDKYEKNSCKTQPQVTESCQIYIYD